MLVKWNDRLIQFQSSWITSNMSFVVTRKVLLQIFFNQLQIFLDCFLTLSSQFLWFCYVKNCNTVQSQLYNDTFTLERFYLQLSVVKEVHIFLHRKSLHLNSRNYLLKKSISISQWLQVGRENAVLWSHVSGSKWAGDSGKPLIESRNGDKS